MKLIYRAHFPAEYVLQIQTTRERVNRMKKKTKQNLKHINISAPFPDSNFKFNSSMLAMPQPLAPKPTNDRTTDQTNGIPKPLIALNLIENTKVLLEKSPLYSNP